MANKAELVRFLDQHVFNPILHAKPNSHGDSKALEDAQRRTEAEKDRFHHYGSADEVVRMYKDDLHSEKAKKVNAELKRLKLPILADVREEFLKLAGESE
jgi:hypothetical protein